MRAPVLSRAFADRLRLLSYAVLAILLAIGLLVAAATLPVLFGYHTYVVNGGSMEPSLKNGSVAVAKATSPFDLEVGDIIARRETADGPAVLHRIARITDDDTGRLLFTQGDANRTPDPQPVMLLGTGDKVIYSVPYVGYILNFGSSTPGLILLIGAPLVLLAGITLYENWPLRLRRRPPESRWSSPQRPRALGSVPLVPQRPPFEPIIKPMRVVLVDVPDFRGLMNAARSLSDLPAAERASVIAFKSGTALLEVVLHAPLPADEIADELRSATGCPLLIEEARPDVLRMRLRFVTTSGQQQLARAA